MICGDTAVVPCYCQEHYDQRMDKFRKERGGKYSPQSCSLCGESGHNRRTCREPRSEGGTSEPSSSSPASPVSES
jgi:hypothetical protein